MSNIIIFHNPRCRKSRAGLAYLESKNKAFVLRKYLTDLLSIDELDEILYKLNKEAIDIVRTQEDYFKKELKNKNFTRSEWLKILVENPRLIKRPIIIVDNLAVIADPPENLDLIL